MHPASAQDSKPRDHSQRMNFWLAAAVIFLAAAGPLAAQQAPSPPPASAAAAATPAINARLYVAITVDTGKPLDLAALRAELRQAGIPVVDMPASATVLLGVWRDDFGFHGALTDPQGASLWAETARAEGDLVHNVSGYLRAHPQPGAPLARPLPAMAGFQAPRRTAAPVFSFKASDSRTYTLESLKGKVALLFFWASWCPVCRSSVPSVVELARKFAGPSFALIGISSDQDVGAWRSYVRQHQMAWPQYLDRDHRLAHLFGIDGVPTFCLIDQKGTVVLEQSGWGEGMGEALGQLIQDTLAGRRPQMASLAPAYTAARAAQPQPARHPVDLNDLPSEPMPELPGASAAAPAMPRKIGGVTAPQPLYEPAPAYPPAARQNGVEGTATLRIVVNAQGRVTEVQQVGAHLGYGLDESAVAAVRTWKFKPATRGGVPVAVRVEVQVAFRLDSAPER